MKTYCSSTQPPHMVPVKPKPGTMRYDPRDLICPDHGTPLKTQGELKPRKSLNRSKTPAGIQRVGMKRGSGFAASNKQQAKVKGLPCIVCGRDEFEEGVAIQAAHVYPRRLQSCDCAEGVVPLCELCHHLYDDQNTAFDLLPYLQNRKYHREFVHAVAEHEAPISEVLRIVTGEKWEPTSELENPEHREEVEASAA